MSVDKAKAKARKLNKIAILAPFEPQKGGMVELAKVLVSMFGEAGYEVARINKSMDRSNPLMVLPLYIRILKAAILSDCIVAISGSGISLWIIDLAAVILARAFGKKVIIDFVGGAAMENARRWFFLKKLVFRLATIVVVPTGKMLSSLSGQDIKAVYHVIPHTADVELFRGAGAAAGEKKGAVLLSAKLLDDFANIDHIIKCAATISREIPDIELWIAGGGPEEARLRGIADEVMPGKVVFFGNVEHEKMRDFMARADLLVHATKYESFGIVLVEAMAAGIPIVSYDAGSISDVLVDGKTGVLVEYGNMGEMASAIARLLKDKELRKSLGENGVRESERYTKGSVGELWKVMMESLR